MRIIYHLILFSALLLTPLAGFAQDRHYVRQGNRIMRSNEQNASAESEIYYRKALMSNQNNSQAIYNQGLAQTMQQKDSAALETYKKAVLQENNPKRKSLSFHNMGVIMQKNHQYAEAIECYKQALRLQPNDNEARYNLVLCQKQIKNNQRQQGSGQANQNDNPKKNKPNDKKQGQNNDKKNDTTQQPQQKQISKENVEQLLNAVIQEEKRTQQRIKDAMPQPSSRNLDKNW